MSGAYRPLGDAEQGGEKLSLYANKSLAAVLAGSLAVLLLTGCIFVATWPSKNASPSNSLLPRLGFDGAWQCQGLPFLAGHPWLGPVQGQGPLAWTHPTPRHITREGRGAVRQLESAVMAGHMLGSRVWHVNRRHQTAELLVQAGPHRPRAAGEVAGPCRELGRPVHHKCAVQRGTFRVSWR